jgi:glutaredoxin
MSESCCSPKKEKKAVLYRMVMPDHLCPYGLKSKDLLEHQRYEVEDHHLTTREETDAFKEKHNVKTTPQTFIGGERIGGYDDLREFFGKERKQEEGTSYTPVIASFGTTFLMALAVAWYSEGTLLDIKTLEYFIAFSMCVLGVQKLRDLFSFTNMFIGYDLLARRYVRYGFVYPFVETGAGIGMLTGIPALMVISALGALFIGTINGISVFKAVYIDKRDLKCACMGGGGKAPPLGFVSLTENIMMVAMAIWMFTKVLAL